MSAFDAPRLSQSVTVTTGASTARVALPTLDSGANPKFVRVLPAGANAIVRPGNSSVVATAQDILCSPNFDLYLNVTGMTHIAYIQQGSATALNIAAVEF